MTDGLPGLDPALIPPAPRWRRLLARAIDLLAVLVVLALFLTPIIATQVRPAASLVRASAWVYVAVFVALIAHLVFGKRKPRGRRQYVTIGPSIMDLHPMRVNGRTRLVRTRYVPDAEETKRGRAAALIAVPMLVLAVGFVALELISYT